MTPTEEARNKAISKATFIIPDIMLLAIEISALRRSSQPIREHYAEAIRDYFAEQGEVDNTCIEIVMRELEARRALEDEFRDMTIEMTGNLLWRKL